MAKIIRMIWQQKIMSSKIVLLLNYIHIRQTILVVVVADGERVARYQKLSACEFICSAHREIYLNTDIAGQIIQCLSYCWSNRF